MKGLSVMKAYTEDIRLALDSEPVCYCSNVTKGQILKAMADGAQCLADIKKATGACRIARCKEMNPRAR